MKFIKNILSKDQPESAKRFFGGLGFISATVVICGWSHNDITTLLYVSAGLLGLGLLDKLKNN
jgi:hypothetical protein